MDQEERKADRGFGGLRVVALESRLAAETQRLVTANAGIPITAPSMREVPIERNRRAVEFGAKLLAGSYDIVVFLTGVGTRYLFAAMETAHPRSALIQALSRTTVVARGPKPLQTLRELGVAVTIAVPEPNTWRELVQTLEEANEGVPLGGSRIAIQEYGEPNDRLVNELRKRGATVEPIAVYRWALPEDLEPLRAAIREMLARTADVILFTSATQARHLMEVARREGVAEQLHDALGELAVGSIGPVCSETLTDLGIAVDFEPSHPKLGHLVKEASTRAAAIIERKRGRRRAFTEPRPTGANATVASDEAVFLKACRRQATPYTPVWLMRQAGRYMQEYREVRAKVGFLELCKTPSLCAEVAVTAQRRIGADAAILFSDILLLLEPMGLGLDYGRGEGPNLSHPVRAGADVERIREVEPAESLDFVFEAVRQTRRALDPAIPLIGFSGAPFTLASYVIEGGGSRNYIATKTLMYSDRGAWDALLARIARAVAAYLNGQVRAGAQALQIFDSWVGCLSPFDYERYVLPHTKAVLDALPAHVPVIHFGTDTAALLDLQVRAGGQVLGVDHRVELAEVCARFPQLAVQGNLDPVALFAERGFLRGECARLLERVGTRPGHIFNLGHGILPGTPVDNVIALVDAVHELSAR